MLGLKLTHVHKMGHWYQNTSKPIKHERTAYTSRRREQIILDAFYQQSIATPHYELEKGLHRRNSGMYQFINALTSTEV